ncbi:uncharacterized protein LOC105761746 [Gossypium raimondii]|uniref:uncharacterized protein LOC105761746 n=1 Tax=Gossypium raimondii TaxID=29730 RepID=UPI00063AAE0C|nr:uncharacterized protein LOC105761746 [Gossypium raimondii]
MCNKIFADRKVVLCFNLDNPKTKTIHVVPYNLANIKNGPSEVHDGVDGSEWKNGLMKTIKRSAIADFLASRALEDYEPLNFDFPDEDLMYVATTEEYAQERHHWKLNFKGMSNAIGNGIRVVLVSPNRDHYPFTSKLDFDCTNNMAEYEACLMGIRVAIERKIKVLEVYGDSALVIYQLKGEWETRDPKLINYRRLVLELIEEFDDITFCYLPRDKNQMADALATLASMVKVNKQKDNREYLDQTTENDKRTMRRLGSDYVLYEEILYKRRNDQVLLRCVEAVEVKRILEEVHEGVCGMHANGFTIARKIMRFQYYWSTMEGDCINYAKRCHNMDVIGPVSPKASNGHRFVFVVIGYFTKWVEAISYANVRKSVVNKFLKKEIICRYGMPEKIISDNALNLNNSTIVETPTGATLFSLVYGMETVLPIEVEISSLLVSVELKLDEAEWIQSRYD